MKAHIINFEKESSAYCSLKTLSTRVFQSRHLSCSEEDPQELRLLADPALGVFRLLLPSPGLLLGEDFDCLPDMCLALWSVVGMPQSYCLDTEYRDRDEEQLSTPAPWLGEELETSNL